MSQISESAAISVQALLVVANSALTIVAGYFIRQFVADVRALTERVASLDTKVAVLESVVLRRRAGEK